jgi:hypothetical protein
MPRNSELDVDHDRDRSPKPLSPLEFLVLVDRFYASLIRHAPSAEAGLGGRLLYVGELDDQGRAMMVAANIAGAASLAAAADAAARKQSIHDGVADFLVTDLDEALRILKNEIRKREPVAVCVAAAPNAIEHEMFERGVQPDLVRDFAPNLVPNLDNEQNSITSVPCSPQFSGAAPNFGGSPALVAPLAPAQHESVVTWSVDEAPAKWLPRLDALAMDCLAADESQSAPIARRWLRFAPRYLGRLARNERVLRCATPTAHAIAQSIRASVESGEVPVRIDLVLQLLERPTGDEGYGL